MLIIGAKGFAKEVLEIVWENEPTAITCFFDDVTKDGPNTLFQQFAILKDTQAAATFFDATDNRFTLGIGQPKLRFQLFEKMRALGGQLVSTISRHACIGHFDVAIGNGCNILAGAQISNAVTIGSGCIIYYNCIVTHDVTIGQFCELSPGVTILGRATIGDFVQIGAGAIIFPDVVIGDHAIIAAGAVVRNHVPAHSMVAGVPATIKKTIL